MNKRNIMIYGGEFFNKGAQAMSFVTISRLKTFFPNHEIYFISERDCLRPESELSKYNFEIIPNPFRRNTFVGENIIRKFLGRTQRKNPKQAKSYLSQTDILFDISGYALSSQWGIASTKNYLNRLNLAHSLGIKTIILPQSIGPFNFDNKYEGIIEDIKQTLEMVTVIMPREVQGERALNEIGIYKNVKQIPDMVLTSRQMINWNHIYKDPIQHKKNKLSENSVVITPNMRNFDHSEKEKIMELYKKAVLFLLDNGKIVYLVRHSFEDLEACRMIKSMFEENNRVKIIEDEMTPTEFEYLIAQADYSIASRFHSVVHSFKANTPCIILGWAIKYQELAKLFEQSKYVFDVRENIELNSFLSILEKINDEHSSESKLIKRIMNETSKFEDPFDYAFNLLQK